MEVLETVESAKSRKRTESNGGNSDSDLSDGWNFVDQIDIQNNDAPSSDGESVEVIEADDESHDYGRDVVMLLDISSKEANTQMAQADRSPVPANLREVSDTTEEHHIREEMFDSSFCWFLFFATVAVVISNLVFMVAENALDWNADLTTETPSFLRDLPTTSKQLKQDNAPSRLPWITREEMIVNTVDEGLEKIKVLKEHKSHKKEGKFENDVADEIKFNKRNYNNNNQKQQRQSLKVNKNDITKYLNALSDLSGSSGTRDKFVEALSILDALHIELNDMEEKSYKNLLLNEVLKKQQNKLQDVLIEVEFKVSKSLDRLATNILNRVEKIERKFENQWCNMKENDHKLELKSSFYTCENDVINDKRDHRVDSEYIKHVQDIVDIKGQNNKKKPMAMDNYQYEADKDSTGKVYSKPQNRDKESEDYYKLVKNEKYDTEKYGTKHKQSVNNGFKHDNVINEKGFYKEKQSDNDHKNCIKGGKCDKSKTNKNNKYNSRESKKLNTNYDNNDNVEKYSEDIYGKKYHKDKNIKIPFEEISKQTDQSKTYRRKEDRGHVKNPKQMSENKIHLNGEDYGVYKSAVETVSKYLKENCEKTVKYGKLTYDVNEYHVLKDGIDDKVRIPKRMFDEMYEKYCKGNHNNFKWDNRNKKEHWKGDFSDKNNNKANYFEPKPLVIEDTDPFIKNIMEIRIVETENENNLNVEPSETGKDKVILPTNKGRRQWVFSYEEPSSDNKTDLSGEWFIKAGESRSKARWLHGRGDWWFDRASHRRSYHQSPTFWFLSRHKNWFFLRAWARHRCRQSPQDNWCTQDETVNFVHSNSNAR